VRGPVAGLVLCDSCGMSAQRLHPPLDMDRRMISIVGAKIPDVEFVSRVEARIGGDEVLNSRTGRQHLGRLGMMIGHYFARDTKNPRPLHRVQFLGRKQLAGPGELQRPSTSVFDSQGNKILENGDLFSGYAVTQVLNTVTNANGFPS